MSLQGYLPVCPDKSVTFGAMQFQWNAETLDGQLISTQRGKCVLSQPGQGQIALCWSKQTLARRARRPTSAQVRMAACRP